MNALNQRSITATVAISSHALAVDVAAGNRILRAATEATPGFYGCLAARVDRPDQAVATLRELAGNRRMLGVLLLGRQVGAPVPRRDADEVLNAYRRYGKAVFILAPDAEAVEAGLEIARAYTMLKVVLLGMGGSSWQQAVAAAEAATNLLLDTSGSLDPAKLPYAVEALGPHRLLFGSGFPHVDPVVGLAALDAAGFGAEAKRKVLEDNARRLFDVEA